MKFTIHNIADNLKIDYLCAAGLVKFLTKKKIFKKVATRRVDKKSHEFLFEGPHTVIIDLTGREQC